MKKFQLCKILFLLILTNCTFFKENKPIQSPGLGVYKKNDIYQIYFDVGIFTFEDQEIQRKEIQDLFQKVITELKQKFIDIELIPVFDQPQDAPFIMRRGISKRLNPNIQNFPINVKFNYINNFIVEISHQDASKKYFLSSQLHHFLYSQVRYDILLIPFPIASDFHYNSSKTELEFHDSEIGISKGRTALDKLGIITYIDYKNIDSMSNQELIKKSLLSFILSLPLETTLEFLKKDCFECDNYLKIRKKIFDIYNNFHNGNLKQGCEDLSLYWKNWIENPFIKKHSLVLIQQLEENYEILQKRCKKS
jgi:hypothetical protein